MHGHMNVKYFEVFSEPRCHGSCWVSLLLLFLFKFYGLKWTSLNFNLFAYSFAHSVVILLKHASRVLVGAAARNTPSISPHSPSPPDYV